MNRLINFSDSVRYLGMLLAAYVGLRQLCFRAGTSDTKGYHRHDPVVKPELTALSKILIELSGIRGWPIPGFRLGNVEIS